MQSTVGNLMRVWSLTFRSNDTAITTFMDMYPCLFLNRSFCCNTPHECESENQRHPSMKQKQRLTSGGTSVNVTGMCVPSAAHTHPRRKGAPLLHRAVSAARSSGKRMLSNAPAIAAARTGKFSLQVAGDRRWSCLIFCWQGRDEYETQK